MSDLEPIAPRDAFELYLESIEGELSPNSVKAKEYQLGFFVRWCEGAEATEPRITDMNDLSGRDILRFKNWRADGINKVTLRTNLSALKQLIRFCVRIDAVPRGLPEKIDIPTLERGENERDSFMDYEEAIAILDYLGTFEYASLNHVLFLLLWQSGARMSGLHSLDVDDVDHQHNRIEFKHRPDEGTRLKNKSDGERKVTLPDETMEVLADYIEVIRRGVTDEYGRRPLFASLNGRYHKNQMNKRLYSVTTPCQVGLECPADKNPLDCEYTGSQTRLLECPWNTRPHDVRRGSITYQLRNEVPEKVVSDRMDVSLKTLDRHYDARTEDEKADIRRDYIEY